MNQFFGLLLVAFGIVLIMTREWSAELHEKLNRQFSWTRWATGPKAMQASRICNVVVGIGLILYGLAWGLGALAFSL